MKHLFLPYNLALLAKEKGFDERCVAYYCDWGNQITHYIMGEGCANSQKQVNNSRVIHCVSPLYQQIIDWFREKHEIIFLAVPHGGNPIKFGFIIPSCYTPNKKGIIPKHEPLEYYEALHIAIEEAFKLI